MDLYCGNLPYSISSDDVKYQFEKYGEVSNVKIIMDRETGRSKGFAFVTMPVTEDGEAAVQGLDGFELEGRKLKVNEARSKT